MGITALDLKAVTLDSDERVRLERAVIEAAKKWNNTNHRDEEICEARLTELGDAVDALLEFEQKQK